MKIIDAFPFFDEIDLLKIRLKTLSPVVDLFVISEFSTSFSGKPKGFILEKHLWEFRAFEDKIVYLKQNQQEILNPFENDHFQKDSIKEHLQNLIGSEDILLFGDLDEIPNPQAIVDAARLINGGTKICHFAQTLSYAYLNMLDQSGSLLSYCGEYPSIRNKKWLGTIATSPTHLSEFTMTQLRDPLQKEYGVRLESGGWHFSYAGGANSEAITRISHKIENNAHQEFNTREVLSNISSRLEAKEDILGRRVKGRFFKANRAQFKVVPIDDSFPIEVQLNQKNYRKLIHDYN